MLPALRWICAGAFTWFVASAAALIILVAGGGGGSGILAAVISMIVSGAVAIVTKNEVMDAPGAGDYRPKTYQRGSDEEDEEVQLTRSGSRDNVRSIHPDDPDFDGD